MNTKPMSFPLNSFVGVAFLLVGVISIIQRAWFDVGTWSSLGLAFLLIGANEQPWPTKPIWRRAGAVIFLLLGIAAIAARIIFDFSHK